jgi:hypothetical protein
MQSGIITRGCAPSDAHPLVETVAQASDMELATIYAFWQAQPDTVTVRTLAIGIIEREILERISLDANEVLTPAQQRRVMTFARSATATIRAFESFYVGISEECDAVWIIYHDHQLGRSLPHAIQVDEDGAVCGALDGESIDRLGARLRIVNIIPLFAEDGTDTMLFNSFKPPLRLAITMSAETTLPRS